MGFKQNLARETGLPEYILPSSYQVVGHVLLVKMPKLNLGQKKKVAKVFLEMFSNVKTVCEITGVSGELRKPAVKKIAGGKTETIHKEHGVLYKLDVSKIMFSKGNLFERSRLVKQIKPGEVVVDMFAGIGYFSVPIAKLAKKIYCIEKNPVSVKYLKENVVLNKVKNIEVFQGDCTKVKLPEKADRRLFLLEKEKPVGKRKLKYTGIADRVIMGYLPKTYKFLPAAFGFLKNRGIIHYHDNFTKKELWKKPIEILEKEAKKAGFKIKILNKRKVKEYAPNVYHVVLDVELNK